MCPLIEKNEYNGSEIINAINSGEDIYLAEKTIIDDFFLIPPIETGKHPNFSQKISSNIAFLGCKFKGQVKIQNVIFENKINFSGCRFAKEVKFWPHSPEFLDDIDLSFAYFKRAVEFHGVKFRKNLRLFNSVFYNGIDFNEAEFGWRIAIFSYPVGWHKILGQHPERSE